MAKTWRHRVLTPSRTGPNFRALGIYMRTARKNKYTLTETGWVGRDSRAFFRALWSSRPVGILMDYVVYFLGLPNKKEVARQKNPEPRRSAVDMTRLSSEQVRRENDGDPSSISVLSLSFRALSDVRPRAPLESASVSVRRGVQSCDYRVFVDCCVVQVSCLGDFRNLARLDISCNNLTSLQVSWKLNLPRVLRPFLCFECRFWTLRLPGYQSYMVWLFTCFPFFLTLRVMSSPFPRHVSLIWPRM